VQSEIVRQETVYRIELGPDQTKTHVHDRFDLPEALTLYVQHYLAKVRPALLNGRKHDAFWIGARAAPLGAKGIEACILRLSRARFGVAFGPHRFRHAIATSSALRDPATPGLAAGVLGGSAQVIEQHYNRAGQIHAARRCAQMLERRRRELGGGPDERRPGGP
jgi:integrase